MSAMEIRVVEDPAAAVAEMLLDAARAGGAHRAHRRLDAQARVRAAPPRPAPTGAARRSGSATSAACRPTTGSSNFAHGRRRRCSARLAEPPADGACGWRASSGREAGAAPTRRSCASSSATTPRWDLLLLGLGPDAHTASLFPGKPEIEERHRRLVVGVRAPGMEPQVPRISLTAAGDQQRPAGRLPGHRRGQGARRCERAFGDPPDPSTPGGPRAPGGRRAARAARRGRGGAR